MTDGFEVIEGDTFDAGSNSPAELIEEPTSRRRLFKMGAVGAAAVGAAAVGNADRREPRRCGYRRGLADRRYKQCVQQTQIVTELNAGAGFLSVVPSSSNRSGGSSHAARPRARLASGGPG